MITNFLHQNLKKIITVSVFFVVIGSLTTFIIIKNPQIFASQEEKKTPTVNALKSISKMQTSRQPAATQPIAQEIKKDTTKVVAKPTSAPKKNTISGKITQNSNGTKTVEVTDGNSLSSEVKTCPTGSTSSYVFVDETGKHADLENTLKAYLASPLKTGAEYSSLNCIKVLNAGATGWAGQYAGSYTLNSSNQITSVAGVVILNTYYYEGNQYFTDYMKLVFSHEYGHHYTLYNKWLKWGLLAGTRFPDDYYSLRSLAKSSTAADYSLGWENCDAEIIAEDYSYLYSGYNYHAMSQIYGYPSSAVASWLANNLPAGPTSTPAVDNPPTVAITSPANNAEVSSTITIQASASDDNKLSKVGFYIGNTLLYEDSASPFETSLNTSGYTNGNYSIKAIAYDDANQTATSTITLIFNNSQVDTTPPTITLNDPTTDPYAWSSGNLKIDASGSDNIQVVRMEIYVNDHFSDTENSNLIIRVYTGGTAGTYVLKIKAYDAAGNSSEKSFVVNKL